MHQQVQNMSEGSYWPYHWWGCSAEGIVLYLAKELTGWNQIQPLQKSAEEVALAFAVH